MNSKLKLSALFLACSLALTGCGGSSSDSGSNSGNGNGGVVTSDQQKAKNFINTLNTMISGVQNVEKNYQQVTNLSDNLSSLGEGTFVVQNILSLLLEESDGTNQSYTTQQITDLLEDAGYDITNSNLTATVGATSVTLKGGFDYAPLEGLIGNTANGQWSYEPVYGDVVTTNTAITATLTASNTNKTHELTLAKGSKISAKTANSIAATLEAKDDTKFTAMFDSAVQLDQLEDTNDLTAASFKFGNIELNTGGTAQDIILLQEFSAEAQRATIQIGNSISTQIIPKKLNFIGKLASGDKKDAADINLSINLKNDLSKKIILSAQGDETATNFANVDISLTVGAQVRTGDKLFTTITAKRAELNKGEAKMTFELNGKKLNGQAWADLPVNGQTEKLKVQLTDGSASITVDDVDQFSSAAIMVNGVSWGTVTKTTDGKYIAKYSDDSMQYIAP